MYTLFLDDERSPDKVTWVTIPDMHKILVVRNYDQFVECIETHGLPEFVCFDHDLADCHYAAMLQDTNPMAPFDYGSEKTGFDCAKFLVNHCADNGYKFPKYVIHSMNPIGKERISSYIENGKAVLDI